MNAAEFPDLLGVGAEGPMAEAEIFYQNARDALRKVAQLRTITASEWLQLAQLAALLGLADEIAALSELLMTEEPHDV